MEKHIPWSVDELRATRGDHEDIVISDSRGNVACLVLDSTENDPEDRKEAEEYAAFIVRAVNCHDELVAALTAMLAAESKVDDEYYADIAEAEKKARAALQKAKE